MKITEHFTLKEMTESATAKKYNIDNTIPDQYMINVRNLLNEVEKVRIRYNKPIFVSSGYRCKELNSKVGGVQNSCHMNGSAVDIKAEDNLKLFNLILTMIKEGTVLFRSVIWEKGKDKPQWIHVDVNSKDRSYRKNKIIYYK